MLLTRAENKHMHHTVLSNGLCAVVHIGQLIYRYSVPVYV